MLSERTGMVVATVLPEMEMISDSSVKKHDWLRSASLVCCSSVVIVLQHATEPELFYPR